MVCKYDIIDEGGRKRVRALRSFTVQGRDVCPMELGGYVYDDKTLSQEGNCWIFSGSLEYPGVHVMDEAIVDMGINLPKGAARPKSVIISGNSRIMGAISFETRSLDVAQTPAMFEQGGYTANVGAIPVKNNAKRVRTPAQLFFGTAGKLAIINPEYEARLISLNEDGIITDATAWAAGGSASTLGSFAPYILVEVRKVGETEISPADVTTAGVSIRIATEAQINVFNSSIVPVYNGSVANAVSILQFLVSGTLASPSIIDIQNSYVRAECAYDKTSTLVFNADFTKVNYNTVMTAGVYSYVSGSFRNTNMNSPASVPGTTYVKRLFDVSDCPDFEFSTVTFPDLAAMITSGKTFYFKNCNMPVGSAIHYYDPKVNTWDNIDFTKAMADLGKKAFADTTIISSNVQGMYRARGNTSGSIGGLLEAASSFDNATYAGTAGATYDCITYKDCVVKGKFTLSGRCVFGGTQGGASRITNTKATAMVVDGSFRIDGNAQVTDTPLKGTGYIGGNAELKNGNIYGYVYMQDNAKVDLPVNTANFRRLIMRDNAMLTKIKAGTALSLIMYGNTLLNGEAVTGSGDLIMGDNSIIDTSGVVTSNGRTELKDNASITGTASLSVSGDVKLIGGFNLSTGSETIIGNQTLSDVSQIAVVELPPTKITW